MDVAVAKTVDWSSTRAASIRQTGRAVHESKT